MPQTQKTAKYLITATHQAFGTVDFRLDAADAKDAFAQFKQIVFNPRQWIVLSNVAADATVVAHA